MLINSYVLRERVRRALREIEEESGADSILQPGAAFALGCLGEAVDCGPGWTAEDVADALRGER